MYELCKISLCFLFLCQMHNGDPHESNYGYAYAKRMIDIHNRSVRLVSELFFWELILMKTCLDYITEENPVMLLSAWV